MERLLTALTDLARDYPDLVWAVPLMRDLPKTPVAPRALPMCEAVLALESPAQTSAVLSALQEVTPHLFWQQSYSEADGFSADWLAQYGWVNVVSPDGPYLSERIRVAIGYWGAGQTYPPHAHEPEESYVVLAGGAIFEAEGRAPRQARPGDLITHAPWQAHAMQMGDQPLLAVAYWRGGNLLATSRFDVVLEAAR